MLNNAQKVIVKANISASSDMNAQPNDDIGSQQIGFLYNAIASPDFWVWKTSVTEAEIVGALSQDSTLFSWSAFISRSQGERDGWMRLFRSGIVNASLPNVQAAINDIFSGAGSPAVAQRTHIFSVFRRKATRLEKLLSTGIGSTAAPAIMGYEGMTDIEEINGARL